MNLDHRVIEKIRANAASGFMKTIQLKQGETIVAVVPRTSEGSGYRFQIVDVYIHDNRKDTVELECIQAVDMSPEMTTLFAAGEAMAKALLAAVPTRRRG